MSINRISIHSVYYVPVGLTIVIYDTKLYERKYPYVIRAVRGKAVLWLDSPADPGVINPFTLLDACHVACHPYWYREYLKHNIPVCGWIPRPIDYDTATKVAEIPREELCRDLWSKYGRYVFTVGSDNRIAPSKPPRKGLDAYDKMCEEIKRKHDIVCLYSGNWDLKNVVKLSYLGGLSEYELLKLMRCAEVFVWTSRSEGFGMPPVEAMSAGSLVVSSNAPFNDLIIGIKFDYTEEKSVFCPEVGFYFKIFDYNVRDLVDAVDYALSLSEDEKEELRLKASMTRVFFRPDLVALALTQV